MPRYLCTVSYDGLNYAGFQRQINSKSIQDEIEKALKNMTSIFIPIHSAGRTDKGVHATGQTFHFDIDSIIPEEIIKKGLNKRLPGDIKIQNVKKVKNTFHARHSAKMRIYEYRIAKKASTIFTERFEVYVENFDIKLVKDCLDEFTGIKNFSGFSKKTPNKIPIKILYSIEIKETKEHYIFIFKGESFLRNMVRSIMGLIIEIATNKKDVSMIEKVFETKDRRLAGKTAEAKGLFLTKIVY
ncbi:tRNA pseudouridine(38-40) synthase TruA [Haploplasma axanthum]|uniref:tRNA pseudouridine synthase A n=1 Tax=Haploplasma axanthum TaxID=29552 RepID=A0A449BCJ1_HAPAX|nr:tRNA pseudouridine(38-40) synthase TruA [Haploplasma axanthum]VEU80156.1 tRNA pseudouridine synthase A [Haploplasma axanthum]